MCFPLEQVVEGENPIKVDHGYAWLKSQKVVLFLSSFICFIQEVNLQPWLCRKEIQRYKALDPITRMVIMKALCEVRVQVIPSISFVPEQCGNTYPIGHIIQEYLLFHESSEMAHSNGQLFWSLDCIYILFFFFLFLANLKRLMLIFYSKMMYWGTSPTNWKKEPRSPRSAKKGLVVLTIELVTGN